jgi:hypothetical protein
MFQVSSTIARISTVLAEYVTDKCKITTTELSKVNI